MKNNYKEDEKELLQIFLDNTVFQEKWKIENVTELFLYNSDMKPCQDLGMELIVRPECNQQCEYCYIYKYGKELYPIKERVDNATILKNLRILLNYVYNEQHIYMNYWALFAGDMFYDGLIFDIFDEFINVIQPIYNTYYNLFSVSPIRIEIPCNCSFLNDEITFKKFEDYVEKLSAVGIAVVISYSGDGKYATDSREKHAISDEYYDKLFSFLKKHKWGCHPMISPENINNQIENIDWWYQMMQKYNMPDRLPMFLEVRNNNWTQENIEKFIELLDHTINKELLHFNNNITDFTKDLFLNKPNYSFYHILPYTKEDSHRHSCAIQQMLHVTLNNLTIVPCHRLTYKQFKYGQFIVQDDKIVDIEPKNLSLGLMLYDLNSNFLPRCVLCPYNDFCIRGCFGAQYENSGELFEPCSSVCNLFKAKFDFLLKKYYNLGVFEEALKNNYITKEQYKKYMICMENSNE